MHKNFKNSTELAEYLRLKEYKNPDAKAKHVFRVEKGNVSTITLSKYEPGWESDFEDDKTSTGSVTLLVDESEYYSDDLFWALSNAAKNIRKKIFGVETAPYANYDDAIKWIESIHNDYSDNHEKYAPKEILFDKKYSELKRLIAEGKALGDIQISYKDLPYEEILRNNKPMLICANVQLSKELSLLEFEINILSMVFRIEKLDLIKFILSDIKPKLRRYEVLKMPGTREQIIIKINVADLSFKEIKGIYDSYRNERGVQKQKVMENWQKYLLELIHELGNPPQSKGKTAYFTKVMDEWNKRHSDTKIYTDWRAIDKAYKNIKDKLKRV